MWLLWMLFAFQDFTQQVNPDWEGLATPWMTQAETQLYQQLSPSQQVLFRGYFVTRRLDDASLWPETGLYLPAFHCPTPHGDIRDQILYALGKPETVENQELVPDLPIRWKYPDSEFQFETLDGQHVALAQASQAAWDKVKMGMILHPEIRYDFREKSFGRTRLPDETLFTEVKVSAHALVPSLGGANLRVSLPIPDSFRDYLRSSKADPIQHMELLVNLKPADQVLAQSEPVFRHGGQLLDLAHEKFLTFEVYLPAGYYKLELLAYSGYLKQGLKADLPIAVKPTELPGISDPILSKVWQKAGIEKPLPGQLAVGETFYVPLNEEELGPVRALVYSEHGDTRLLLQTGESSVWLKQIGHEGAWWVFEVPARSAAYRLISLGFPPSGSAVALGAHGSLTLIQDTQPLDFEQDGKPNYLTMEELTVKAPSDLTLLMVNDQPYLASRDGHFDWRSLDWGKVAQLRFEYARNEGWTSAAFKLRRSGVFEQMEVKPQYIVAATRKLDGSVSPVPVTVSVVGQPVKVVRATPYKSLPKLWGVVVNDPLLKSQAWPSIRNSLKTWLLNNTGPNDLTYVIHNSDRPRMLLEPTAYKPLVSSAIDALVPLAPNDSYFTVKYLIDALTHLNLHQSRPHQVLILTNGLTGEINQMEDLIPKLRSTGLQLYNMEFPYETPPQDLKGTPGERALQDMATMEELRRRDRMGMRDHFLEDRDGIQVGKYQFGKKKNTIERLKADRAREEAFTNAFNRQLATLTAGLAQTAAFGQTATEQTKFFQNLTAWQDSLVHLELSVPYLDQGLIKVEAPEGYSASWTLVSWQPKAAK